MKNILKLTIALLVLVSCSKEKENMMLVEGEIKNLKKGTLYLQKMQDTVLKTVDSIKLDGVQNYQLSDAVESPEIYFLSLDKSPSKLVSFFGEKGTITINTKLDKFQLAAAIQGLSNQQLLDEYNEMKTQFSNKRLDLIKADFEAKKASDSLKIDSIQQRIESLRKGRYRFAISFALRNADKEVAPYLALTEFYDANLVWLDSVQSALSPEVKKSKYGKALNEYLTKIKN